MKAQIENLKTELREFLELSKTITPEKWLARPEIQRRDWEPFNNGGAVDIDNYQLHGMKCDDATFIARARNISPAMAECLLVAVEGLEWMIFGDLGSEVCDNDGRCCPACAKAEEKLKQILTICEASK